MVLLALIDCLSYLLCITFNNTLITNHGRTTISIHQSINSYKAKSHYNIFLQFHEATSSQGPTKSLSSVYTSTKYHQEMKRPQNNWCKSIEEPRGSRNSNGIYSSCKSMRLHTIDWNPTTPLPLPNAIYISPRPKTLQLDA
jgi:hypothetical protein